MKYLFLILILCASSPTLSTQPSLLASVETIEARTTTTPPVEKKKLKKKLKKKHLKKRFKKPNKLKKTNVDPIKIGILFNLIGTASLSAISTTLTILTLLTTGSIIYIIFLVVAGVTLFFALIFLTVFLVYMAAKKRIPKKKKKNRKNEKKIILKKTEEVLRNEVVHLDPKQVALYLSLNEVLTAATIRKNSLMRNREEQSVKEWAVTKLEIKELDDTINRTQVQISELRRQNKINKVLKSRG